MRDAISSRSSWRSKCCTYLQQTEIPTVEAVLARTGIRAQKQHEVAQVKGRGWLGASLAVFGGRGVATAGENHVQLHNAVAVGGLERE